MLCEKDIVRRIQTIRKSGLSETKTELWWRGLLNHSEPVPPHWKRIGMVSASQSCWGEMVWCDLDCSCVISLLSLSSLTLLSLSQQKYVFYNMCVCVCMYINIAKWMQENSSEYAFSGIKITVFVSQLIEESNLLFPLTKCKVTISITLFSPLLCIIPLCLKFQKTNNRHAQCLI